MNTRKSRITFGLFIGIALSILLAGCGSANTDSQPDSSSPSATEGSSFTHEFQLTTPLGDSHTAVQIWTDLFAELEEKTDGRLTGKVFSNSQLGGGNMNTTVDMVQKGTIDIGVFGSPLLGGYVPEFRVPTTAFLFDDFETADKALNDEAVMNFYREKSGESGYYFMGWMENSWNEITNNKKELILPEDMQGLKMRVAAGDIVIAGFQAAGANVVDMSLNELYTALQQGVADGQENGVSGAITANKLYEVQKYMTYTQYSYSPFAVVMNKKLWDEIPADDQAILTTLFEKYAPMQIQQNRESMEENLEFVKSEGMIVHVMTPEEREQWKAVMGPEAPDVQKVLDTYDQDFVKMLIDATH
ncbi:TRAP transporter substrate-binding protein [Alkalihalobacillus oceani]|uniref:TRAP transporter substrate-binding protein n=1 Tax=Halalkalibacter oceani TaxID=1653776 RepID=A0A9X2DPG6_9BACI|nr:TRAP transporter substrate-binding protein [Halalkalibacter oceani]MCM3713957.1 TRAP transporter substrate-binding protein [Halalkalibacter oceani]